MNFVPALGVGLVAVAPVRRVLRLVVAEGDGRVLGGGAGVLRPTATRRGGGGGEAVCGGLLLLPRRDDPTGGRVAARGQRLGVVVRALVDDLRDAAVGQGPLHLLLHGAAVVRALVVAARVLAPFHLLLPVLAPVVTVLQLRVAAVPAAAAPLLVVARRHDGALLIGRRCRFDLLLLFLLHDHTQIDSDSQLLA